MHYLLSLQLSSNICPGVGLLDREVVLFFEEPSLCFPYWVHQFTFPPTVFKYFFFSTSLPTFICVLLDDGYFGRCEGVTSVGVGLHFFDDYRCKASFPVLVCNLYVFFAKNVY